MPNASRSPRLFAPVVDEVAALARRLALAPLTSALALAPAPSPPFPR